MPLHVNNGEHYTVTEFRLTKLMEVYGFAAVEDLVAEFDSFVHRAPESEPIMWEGFEEHIGARYVERLEEAERASVTEAMERA